MLYSDIITTIARQLQDQFKVTFPNDTLVEYLNLSVRAIIDAKPSTYPVTGNITLVAGTRQSIPTGWRGMIEAKRNMGSGNTPGRVITPMLRSVLAEALPDWEDFPDDAEVRHVLTDDADPYHFDVFPPQPIGTTQKIEAVGSIYPDKSEDDTMVFPLHEQYERAAIFHVIHLALFESTTIPNALAKSQTALGLFYRSLGVPQQGAQ